MALAVTVEDFQIGRVVSRTFGALSLAVQLICPYIMQAALVRGTLTDLNGERPSLGKTLSTGLSLFHPETLVTLNRTNLIVVKWIESVVVYSIAAVGATAIYYELRTVKEGVAPEQLAAAFD